LKTAEEFVKKVLKIVQEENPQLRFNLKKIMKIMGSGFTTSQNVK